MNNADKKPSFDQPYWVSQDNEVLIDKSDSQFKAKGVYKVAITPFLLPEDEEKYFSKHEELDFQYSVKFTLTNKHSIMAPGITESGFLVSKIDETTGKMIQTSQCFIIESPPSHKNILLTKSLASKTSLYVNIESNNFRPDVNDHLEWARNDEIGVFLGEKQLKAHCSYKNGFCRIYACLYGMSGERYSIKYVHDKKPSLAKTGDLIYDPVPLQGTDLQYFYHPDKNKPLDIEEGSKNEIVEIFTVCIEENDIKSTLKFPNALVNQKSSSFNHDMTGVHYTAAELKNYKKPICLVTARIREGVNFVCSTKDSESS